MASNKRKTKNNNKHNTCVRIFIAICAFLAAILAAQSAYGTHYPSGDANWPLENNRQQQLQQPAAAKSVAERVSGGQLRSVRRSIVADGANSRGSDELSVASWTPTVALASRSDALDSLTGGDLVPAAGEKKYMLVKKKPKYKKIKMEVLEPKMKYKKIKMKVPVKMMKKKKVKGYMVKKEHDHHHY